MWSIVNTMCLKPSFSLRLQLLRSFGSAALVAYTIVIVVTCVFTHLFGVSVKGQASTLLRDSAVGSLVSSSKLAGAKFNAWMENLESAVDLLVTAVEERIVGYPEEGWMDDRFVPFFDMDSRKMKYPLKSDPLPFEWNITPMDPASATENAPFREHWLAAQPFASTATPSYFIQGACDPSLSNPNCTDANNDISTGGVVQPTSTSQGLHEKASDLKFILKSVFEAHIEIIMTGFFFHNSGAGAAMNFPGLTAQFRPSKPMYQSIGCDWMSETNPYTGRPYATVEEIKRCRPAGVMVPQSVYNPMERAWARDVVLNQGKTLWYGPFPANEDTTEVILLIAKAIFDRRTKELIGVAVVDIYASDLQKELSSASLNENSSLWIVRYRDGVIVSSSSDSSSSSSGVGKKIWDVGAIPEEKWPEVQQKRELEGEWTPESLFTAFSSSFVFGTKDRVTSQPLPTPPDIYDPGYYPEFLLVYRFNEDVVSTVVDTLDSRIATDVLQVALLSALIGIMGMILVVVMVSCVSRVLTRPLLWMETIAWGIVNRNKMEVGEVLNSNSYEDSPSLVFRMPRTEITKLVKEFKNMIRGFSREGGSAVVDSTSNEIHNETTWRSDFQRLYKDSKAHNTGKKSTDSTSLTNSTEETSDPLPTKISVDMLVDDILKAWNDSAKSTTVLAPQKMNLHLNIRESRPNGSPKRNDSALSATQSSLFWWILGFIVFPMVGTSTLICGIMSQRIKNTIPTWVEIAESSSLNLEVQALQLKTTLKAEFIEIVMAEVIRDLHVLTRTGGWLLFGGLQRSESFTRLEYSTDQCKEYLTPPSFEPCPSAVKASVCDCRWGDDRKTDCLVTNSTDTRLKQHRFFAAQARDTNTTTGNRMSASSFPEFDNSPNATIWWSNLTNIPGSFKGSNASGLETAYDRIRVSSAMAVIDIPLYNYKAERKNGFSLYLAMEADGMVTGYTGCEVAYPYYALNEITSHNRPLRADPELCPVGKFGYDPRCESWYVNGKFGYLDTRATLSITEPYSVGISDVGMTATSPLSNPSTGEYAGQVALEFVPRKIQTTFQTEDMPLYFVVPPSPDDHGPFTVASNRQRGDWEPLRLMDLVFEFDPPESNNRLSFQEDIMSLVYNGTSGGNFFSRTGVEGNEEVLKLTVRPVHVTSFLAVDPSDFKRGVTTSSNLVYSVGVGYYESVLRAPFRQIQDEVNNDLRNYRTTYIVIITTVLSFFLFFSIRISIQVTMPVVTLLQIVKTINGGAVTQEIPSLHGGCRETHRVYSSLAKLYKVVRISNVALFTGNLLSAHTYISDALKLFRQVGEERAIGIACNNMGNILYTMAIRSKGEVKELSFEVGASIYVVAERYFTESITICKRQLELEKSLQSKAIFAEQLSDRLFNRSLLLLAAARTDGENSSETKRRALSDLEKVRKLDSDVKKFWIEQELLFERSDQYFDRLIRRVNGLACYYDDEEVRELWDARKVLESCDSFLFASWSQTSAPLFKSYTQIGRLQMLEGAAARLELRLKRNAEAARIAIRAFSEDEFILESTFVTGANALLHFFREKDSASWRKSTRISLKKDFRKMIRSCKTAGLELDKCVVVAAEVNEMLEGSSLLTLVNAHVLKLYDETCSKADHVGVIAYTTGGDLSLQIGQKEGNEELHRYAINLATTCASERMAPAFPYAFQTVVDAAVCNENDSFILLITDGYSWDPAVNNRIRLQIERLNAERDTSIHVIIVGLEIEEAEVVEDCKEMSSVSKKSMFSAVTTGNVDQTFEKIRGMLQFHPDEASNHLLGITMEKL